MENQELVNQLIANGRKALAELESYTQEQIDELCRVCCEAFAAHAEELAAEAVAETGLGNVPDKIAKNTGSPDGVWYAIKNKKSVGVIGHDERRHLTFVAHPKGIISCVIPTTNPNITILFNGVYALKGRNVILCAPHPRAKRSTVHTCKIFQEALRKAGAPENIFQYVEEPNIELTQMMMAASDTVLGTGGPNMVKAAYSSGKPAYGVGPGNSQTIFDPEYDNLPMAVGQTVFGCKFDNGIICACNRSFITPRSISAKVVELMKAEKVFYVDDPAVRDRARALLFPNGLGAINGKPVGQDVQKIARMLELDIPADTSIIVIKVDKYGTEDGASGRAYRVRGRGGSPSDRQGQPADGGRRTLLRHPHQQRGAHPARCLRAAGFPDAGQLPRRVLRQPGAGQRPLPHRNAGLRLLGRLLRFGESGL